MACEENEVRIKLSKMVICQGAAEGRAIVTQNSAGEWCCGTDCKTFPFEKHPEGNQFRPAMRPILDGKKTVVIYCSYAP